MSYCITQDEIDRRGICADASCAPPLTIRETIIEPLLTEPLFESDPFLPSFIGGGGDGGRRRPWQKKPSWKSGKPSWKQTVGGGGAPTTSIMQPRGSTTNYVADTGKANVTRSVVSRGPEYTVQAGTARVTRSVDGGPRYTAQAPTARARAVVSRGTEYRVSSPGYARVTRSVSPSQQTSNQQSTARVSGKALKGFGQISIETGVSPRWKWAALGLVGLLGVQFWWWNKKAPQVLKLGGY
jgi:hypothetical protein